MSTETPINRSSTPDDAYNPWRFCIAPMIDVTDTHYRSFIRLLTQHARLYTEMVTTGALIHGHAQRYLSFNKEEHPVAIQLGSNEPDALAICARMAEDAGFDEVNLNVGCPSDRVQSGAFGACLMKTPDLVAECFLAMEKTVSIPVTVKCRIGVDDMDEEESIVNFVTTLADAGCKVFIIHARKAWLQGLSPKENRNIPPLNYSLVHQIKQSFPQLTIVINGGLKNMSDCDAHLQHVDGVMIGRAAYEQMHWLAEVDGQLFGRLDRHAIDDKQARIALLEQFYPYITQKLQEGTALKHMSRHVLPLMQGLSGARNFRRYISENAHKADADLDVLRQAVNQLQ